MLRSPALPLEIARELLDSADPCLTLYELLQRRRDIVEIVRLASGSLGGAIDSWLSGPFDPEHRAVLPAFSYVLRCCTRSTPLAACAAVSEQTNESGELRCDDEIRRRTRPDAGWLLSLIAKIERRAAAIPGLRLWRSGLAYDRGGRVEVADFTRTMFSPLGNVHGIVAVPTAMNRTRALDVALEMCEPGVTIDDLASRIAESLAAPKEHAIELIERLLSLGIFVSELRVALTRDPANDLLEALERLELPEAVPLRAILDECRIADAADIVDANVALSSAEKTAAELTEASAYVQIDSSRTVYGSIDDSIWREVASVLEALVNVSQENPAMNALASAFSERYNIGREVALLEVLDTQDGFAFEDVINAVLPRPKERDRFLARLSHDAIACKRESIDLDDTLLERIAALSQKPKRLPATVEAICRVVTEGKTQRVVFPGGIRGAFRTMGRFSDMLPGLHSRVRAEIANEHADENWIEAELAAYPHARRSANVATRRRLLEYEVVSGIRSSTDEAHTITLDELVVGARDGRLYLRCARLDKYVSIRPTHMLNPQGASRLELFMSYMNRDPDVSIAFDWGSVAAELPYLPRVVRGSTILSPRMWKVPVDAVASREALESFRQTWNVPSRCSLVRFDNRLPVDLKSEVGRALLVDAARDAKTQGSLLLEEPLQEFANGPLRGNSGTYALEAVLPYRVVQEPNSPKVLSFVVPRAASLRPPGGEWLAIHAYLGNERAAFFLERSMASVVQTLMPFADKFHFLRYTDPAYHLRVRFHASHDPVGLLVNGAAHFNALTCSSVISRFAIQTYDREVERYGGPDAIDVAEDIFFLDSMRVLSELGTFRREREAMAISSIARFARNLLGGVNEAKEWLEALFGRRRRLPKQAWLHVRQARTHYDREGGSALEQRLCERSRDYRSVLVEETRDHGIAALIHMHCNRLGLNRTEEFLYMHAASAMLDQVRHMEKQRVEIMA